MNDRNAPATRGDIPDLEHTFDELRGEMNHNFADLAQRIADRETRLLKAFYDFAQSNHKRMTAVEVSQSAMRNRLATIEDRLLQIEKRLNLSPAA